MDEGWNRGDKRMAEQAEVPVSLGDKYRFQLKTKGLKEPEKVRYTEIIINIV